MGSNFKIMFDDTTEDRDERIGCARIICEFLNVKTLDVTTSAHNLQGHILPIETVYTIVVYKTTDNININMSVFITPQGRIVIEIRSGCWNRVFDIKHPNTFKYLINKLQKYDFWDLNAILSKPINISSFT